MKNEVLNSINETGLIVIARDIEKTALFKLTEALIEGGVRIIELPFDIKDTGKTAEIAKTIESLKMEFGDKMHFGAGTVLTKDQVRLAFDHGSELIVSPDVNPAIIEATLECDLVSVPGAYTATEIALANRVGADFVKLFPALQAGEGYIKMLSQPLDHIKLIVFGGITLENYKRFLIAGAMGAGVGDALVNDRYIASENYQVITNTAKQFIRTKQECKPKQ